MTKADWSNAPQDAHYWHTTRGSWYKTNEQGVWLVHTPTGWLKVHPSMEPSMDYLEGREGEASLGELVRNIREVLPLLRSMRYAESMQDFQTTQDYVELFLIKIGDRG